MGKQPGLFGQDERYAPFEESLTEDYPRGEFKPLHPAFIRKGKVNTSGVRPTEYFVDLSIGECQCQKGFAFAWDRNNSKWYKNAYCNHKMRAIASIVNKARQEKHPQEPELTQGYLMALGTRYNPFETVSAFHKELRRGDYEQAWFWGLMLANKRGLPGVIFYLLNILYEETRDHDLGVYLLDLLKDRTLITLSSVARAIAWFCAAKKKWELPHRMQIFEAEMAGYQRLVDAFGQDVAKGGNIIPKEHAESLRKSMLLGFKNGDLAKMQMGLKGLQKLKYSDKAKPSEDELEAHRYWLYEMLYHVAEERLPDTHEAWGVFSYVNRRITDGRGIGYHELNALADAIAGEPVSAGLLIRPTQAALRKRPTPEIKLGYWPPIPIYAQDNHTYDGKRRMRKHPEELKPGAKQEHLDFRGCGAYFGVAWRMLAGHQFPVRKWKDIAWHEVKWPPSLYKTVSVLFY